MSTYFFLPPIGIFIGVAIGLCVRKCREKNLAKRKEAEQAQRMRLRNQHAAAAQAAPHQYVAATTTFSDSGDKPLVPVPGRVQHLWFVLACKCC